MDFLNLPTCVQAGFLAKMAAKDPSFAQELRSFVLEAAPSAPSSGPSAPPPAPSAQTRRVKAPAALPAAIRPAHSAASSRPAPPTASPRPATPRPVAPSRAALASAPSAPMPGLSCEPARAVFDSPMSPDMEISSSCESDDSFRTVTRKGKRRRSLRASPTSSEEAPLPPNKTAKVRRDPARPASPNVESAQPPKAPPPPPVFIQDKSSWTKVSAALSAKRINFTHARSTAAGIKVLVPTSDDHRALTRFLRESQIGFHTYSLPENRVFRAVIRGVPKELDTTAVLSDLKAQGFPIREVHRILKRDKSPLDLVLVILDLTPEGREIMTTNLVVCHISGLKVEHPRKRNTPGQCHNCQLYGHSARNCFARARCVKCLGDHATPECPRPQIPDPANPPSCVLCGAVGHTANYRGCPRAPRKPLGKPARAQNSAPARSAPSAPPAPSSEVAFPSLPLSQKINAWFKPASPAPSAPFAAERTQLPRPTPRAMAPRPSPPAPLAPHPPARSRASFANDLELVLGLVNVIDVDEISVLASKLRAADGNLQQMVAAIFEHNHLVRTLKSVTTTNVI
jgi:hypothetical protein